MSKWRLGFFKFTLKFQLLVRCDHEWYGTRVHVYQPKQGTLPSCLSVSMSEECFPLQLHHRYWHAVPFPQTRRWYSISSMRTLQQPGNWYSKYYGTSAPAQTLYQ
eukprot:2651311-Rhodomonas_salina.2